MKNNVSYLPTLCAMAVASLLLVACGGGDSANGGSATFTTSTGAKTNGVVGKNLFLGDCASCHGASMAAAVDYSRTLGAIASNRGGMGFLAGTIKTGQADDIATYMAFGAVL